MNSSHFKKVILLLVSIGIIILVILGLRIGDIPTGFSDIYNAVFNYSENNFNHCFPINLNVLLKMLNIVYEIDLV